MPTLQELVDQRNGLWSQMSEIVEGKGEFSDKPAEARAKYAELEKDFDALETDIRQRESHAEREAKLSEIREQPLVVTEGPAAGKRVSNEEYEDAFRSFLRDGIANVTPEQRELLQSRFTADSEMRAQGVATGGAGGFTVPEGFRAVVTETLKEFGGVRQVANVISTDSGNDLPWPGNDDTGNEGAILGEGVTISAQDLTFTSKTLKAHMYTSKLIKVSWQLLQDSGIDIESFIGRKAGERVGRIHNKHFTIGVGTTEPEGIQTNATIGKTGAAGQVTTVTFDDLIDLEHSVDVAYRNIRCGYMFHDLTLAKLRKLKDNDARPLFQPAPAAGAPSTINGWKYTINNNMPVMAASAKAVLFGDFHAAYIVRDVLGIHLRRLDERYADDLSVGFFVFARADAKPDDAAAVRAYANPAA